MLLMLVVQWRFMGNPVPTVWDEVTHIPYLKLAVLHCTMCTMARILDVFLVFSDVCSIQQSNFRKPIYLILALQGKP